MAKQQTAETLSPLSVVTGATALAVSGQRTIALQNYVDGRRPQTHYASGYLVSLTEVAPSGLVWPNAGTITPVVTRAYLEPEVVTLTIGLEAYVASAGTTLRMTVRVGGASGVSIDATSANNGAEQTTTVAISSTGTGWQTIEVDLVRVSGAATGYVRYVSVQDTPITNPADLPDPANA